MFACRSSTVRAQCNAMFLFHWPKHSRLSLHLLLYTKVVGKQCLQGRKAFVCWPKWTHPFLWYMWLHGLQKNSEGSPRTVAGSSAELLEVGESTVVLPHFGWRKLALQKEKEAPARHPKPNTRMIMKMKAASKIKSAASMNGTLGPTTTVLGKGCAFLVNWSQSNPPAGSNKSQPLSHLLIIIHSLSNKHSNNHGKRAPWKE